MAAKDLTVGNPCKLIVLFAIPLFIGNICNILYSVIDLVIVGRVIGVNGISAIGATGAICFCFMGFLNGATTGFSVITGQRFGAKNLDAVRESFATNIVLSIALSVVFSLALGFLTPLFLKILNTPSDIFSMTEDYLSVLFFGIPTLIFYYSGSAVSRALGDSKNPLWTLTVGLLINIVFDYIAIVYFDMGVMGAAVGTVICEGITAILMYSILLHKFKFLKISFRDLHVGQKSIREHLRQGIPMGLQLSVLSIGMIVLQIVLNSFGSVVLAGYTAASRVDQISVGAGAALGVAVTAYTAQNYGAKNIQRIKDGIASTMRINFCLCAMMFIMVYGFGTEIVSQFLEKPSTAVIDSAMTYLHISAVFYFPLCAIITYRSVLQAIGETRAPLVSSLIELVARIFSAIILGNILGYVGVCTATPFAWLTAGTYLYISYRIKIKSRLLQYE